MMLVRSMAGRLSAATLLDRGDEGGPMRHWPARTLGALHMLAELQFRIDKGWLPKLPDFVAILNPHDGPEQIKNHGKSWCGTIPLPSNSRIAGRYFDLMAPDFSFAPFGGGALTNGIYGLNDAKTGGLGVNGSAYVVPTGWDDERRRIYEAGRAQLWAEKAPTLFWRGGETNGVRRAYVGALNNRSSGARPPADVLTDVHLCAAHCAPGEGAALVDWCRRRLLLSLPGATFAIGFKYTLLCSSLVVRGGIKEEGSGGGGDDDEFAAERAAAAADNAAAGTAARATPASTSSFGTPACAAAATTPSKRPDDLGGVVAAALDSGGADVIARRGGDYVYQTLTRDFVAEYWHRLFAGQAALYSDWSSLTSGSDALLGGAAAKDWKCSGGASRAKLGKYEKMCVGGGTGCPRRAGRERRALRADPARRRNSPPSRHPRRRAPRLPPLRAAAAAALRRQPDERVGGESARRVALWRQARVAAVPRPQETSEELAYENHRTAHHEQDVSGQPLRRPNSRPAVNVAAVTPEFLPTMYRTKSWPACCTSEWSTRPLASRSSVAMQSRSIRSQRTAM